MLFIWTKRKNEYVDEPRAVSEWITNEQNEKKIQHTKPWFLIGFTMFFFLYSLSYFLVLQVDVTHTRTSRYNFSSAEGCCVFEKAKKEVWKSWKTLNCAKCVRFCFENSFAIFCWRCLNCSRATNARQHDMQIFDFSRFSTLFVFLSKYVNQSRTMIKVFVNIVHISISASAEGKFYSIW